MAALPGTSKENPAIKVPTLLGGAVVGAVAVKGGQKEVV
jgi:hypothetical protein